MSDWYVRAVNRQPGRRVAGTLGLPRPAPLVRERLTIAEHPAPSPLLLIGADPDLALSAGLAGAHRHSGALFTVHQASDPGQQWAGIVLNLSGIRTFDEVSPLVMQVGASLRQLQANGRVVLISDAPSSSDSPVLAAAREGVEGLMRSLAKELRDGATANGIQLSDGASLLAALPALLFLLSNRSSFVDGQMITVNSTPAEPMAPPGGSLQGRVAVVTGAARGIGAAIAEVLMCEGATLLLVDVPAAGEGLAAVANRLAGTALQLDITDQHAGQRIHEAAARYGSVDILVHNAGILRDKLLVNMRPEQWDTVISVNVAAPIRITEYLLAAQAFGEQPRVVSLASTSGIAGNKGQTNYGFSKAGVMGATRALAPLMAAIGGTANAVAPGFIETEMTASIPPLTREVARRASSLHQGGLPVDVAEVVAFLGSGQAAGINGQVLRVCGQNLVGR